MCKTMCVGTCLYTCRNKCKGSCTGGCQTQCKGGCKGGCTGCSGKCSSVCGNSCGNNCQGGCKSGCEGSCGGGCTGRCTGCKGGCGGSCSGSCGGSCSGTSTGEVTYEVFDWYDKEHSPVKDETILILASDWNKLTDLIALKTNNPAIAADPTYDEEGEPIYSGSAKVKQGEVFSAYKYNLLADALGLDHVSNNHSYDSSLITADVIDNLRIYYNE